MFRLTQKSALALIACFLTLLIFAGLGNAAKIDLINGRAALLPPPRTVASALEAGELPPVTAPPTSSRATSKTTAVSPKSKTHLYTALSDRCYHLDRSCAGQSCYPIRPADARKQALRPCKKCIKQT